MTLFVNPTLCIYYAKARRLSFIMISTAPEYFRASQRGFRRSALSHGVRVASCRTIMSGTHEIKEASAMAQTSWCTLDLIQPEHWRRRTKKEDRQHGVSEIDVVRCSLKLRMINGLMVTKGRRRGEGANIPT